MHVQFINREMYLAFLQGIADTWVTGQTVTESLSMEIEVALSLHILGDNVLYAGPIPR